MLSHLVLCSLLAVLAGARATTPTKALPLRAATGAERLLGFGVLFVLVVFFFPNGALGTVREALARRRRPPAAQEA